MKTTLKFEDFPSQTDILMVILKAREEFFKQRCYGPFYITFSREWENPLLQDYSPYRQGTCKLNLRTRIEEIEHVREVRLDKDAFGRTIEIGTYNA